MTENSVSPAGSGVSEGGGRERVLNAFAELLREQGVAGATLGAVAERAGMSKGGLLHHFASKDALADGLLARLLEENRLNIERISALPHQRVAAYLRASMSATNSYSATLMASFRLAGIKREAVEAAMSAIADSWRVALDQWVSDPATVRLIQLVADGLYLRAMVGVSSSTEDAAAVRFVRELADDM